MRGVNSRVSFPHVRPVEFYIDVAAYAESGTSVSVSDRGHRLCLEGEALRRSLNVDVAVHAEVVYIGVFLFEEEPSHFLVKERH